MPSRGLTLPLPLPLRPTPTPNPVASPNPNPNPNPSPNLSPNPEQVCREAGWAAIALGGASIGTFMVKTLRQALVAGSGSFTPGFVTEGMGSPGRKEQKKKQNYMLYAVAVAQFPFLWWLCRV